MPPRPCGRGRATRRRSDGQAMSAGCRAMTRLGIDLNIHIMEDNLHYMRTEPPLLAPVFRSEGQARLLAAVLLGGDELSITDLADRAEGDEQQLTQRRDRTTLVVGRDQSRLPDRALAEDARVQQAGYLPLRGWVRHLGPVRQIRDAQLVAAHKHSGQA